MSLLPGLDRRHAGLRELLAVSLTLLVARLVLVLEDVDLRALGVLEDLGGDGDLRECVRVGGHGALVDEEHGGEVEGVTRRTGLAVELDDVADGNLLLSAASTDDRVHRVLLKLVTKGETKISGALVRTEKGPERGAPRDKTTERAPRGSNRPLNQAYGAHS